MFITPQLEDKKMRIEFIFFCGFNDGIILIFLPDEVNLFDRTGTINQLVYVTLIVRF